MLLLFQYTPSTMRQQANGSADGEPSKKRPIDHQTILKALYICTSLLCAFMVSWILVFPSSWLMGHSDLHDRWVDTLIVNTYDGVNIPPATITKYAGHPAVQFSHILPGAFWAAAIPFQIHPDMRRNYRGAHRRVGYVFFGSSILQAIGVLLILTRKLTFEHDYATLPPFDTTQKLKFEIGMVCQTLWFVYTAGVAAYKVRAGDIASHRRYVLRHIASGLWVAVQRLIVVGAYKPATSRQMRTMFSDAGFIGMVCCSLAAEWAIYLLEKQRHAGRGKTTQIEKIR